MISLINGAMNFFVVSTFDKPMIRCNFWPVKQKISADKVQNHLNFRKYKVALNPTYRNFLNFAKRSVLSSRADPGGGGGGLGG